MNKHELAAVLITGLRAMDLVATDKHGQKLENIADVVTEALGVTSNEDLKLIDAASNILAVQFQRISQRICQISVEQREARRN